MFIPFMCLSFDMHDLPQVFYYSFSDSVHKSLFIKEDLRQILYSTNLFIVKIANVYIDVEDHRGG